MFKRKILIIFFFLFNFKVNAAENFVIVDVDFLLNNSKAGIYIKESMKSNTDKIIKKFQSKEKELKEEEKKVLSQKKILSEEDFKKKVSSLNKEIIKYTDERKKSIEDSRKKRNEATKKLLAIINSLLVEYADKNNISLIIDKKNIIMVKNENDVTKEIFELLNKKVNKIKVK